VVTERFYVSFLVMRFRWRRRDKKTRNIGRRNDNEKISTRKQRKTKESNKNIIYAMVGHSLHAMGSDADSSFGNSLLRSLLKVDTLVRDDDDTDSEEEEEASLGSILHKVMNVDAAFTNEEQHADNDESISEALQPEDLDYDVKRSFENSLLRSLKIKGLLCDEDDDSDNIGSDDEASLGSILQNVLDIDNTIDGDVNFQNDSTDTDPEINQSYLEDIIQNVLDIDDTIIGGDVILHNDGIDRRPETVQSPATSWQQRIMFLDEEENSLKQ